MSETKDKEKKEIVLYNKEYLQSQQGVGMSRVDPKDIRPPEVRLIQKSSDFTSFVDSKGKVPITGQFFHNGRLEIFDTFECYLIFAAKSVYIDKRKPEEGEKEQYRAIGVMADDFSLFGMVFRSSALHTLSPLFTATVAGKRPMYSIKARFETKELQGEKGTWRIPVLRIVGFEEDPKKLKELEEMALRYDLNADKIVEQKEEEETEEQIDDIFKK